MLTEINKKQITIGGLIPFSTIDFPDHLAAVIFLQGCPFACSYCHNPQFIDFTTKGLLTWQAVEEFLLTRKGWLDSVVFSGGEPLAQQNLIFLAEYIKDLGFKVGLHTNGYYPERLKNLLDAQLIDWIGFDIKAAWQDYATVSGLANSDLKVRQSVELLLDHQDICTFRTTIHPKVLDEKQLLNLVKDLANLGIKYLVLQKFRETGCIDKKLLESDASYYPSLDFWQVVKEIPNIVVVQN